MSFASGAPGLMLVTHESPANPPPAKTHQRGPSIAELDAINLPDYGNIARHSKASSIMSTGPCPTTEEQTPKTPDQLESSSPHEEAAGIVPSFWFPYMNRWRVMAACLTYFCNGINDSSQGALIPYIEKSYHIGYAVVSLIFVTVAAGFILAACFTELISGRLGRAKSLMLCEALLMIGYTIAACTPPFPVVVMAFLPVGFGYGINLALNNVFCANLTNSTVILGLAHGSYGIGGIVGPILATSLVSNGILWSRFYIITIGLRAVCMAVVGWTFWNYEKEGITHFHSSLEQIANRQRVEAGEPTKLKLFQRALQNRATIIGALFIFAYQGAEVSESGWFISYLINYRNGDPTKVGYVTSGFWAGITIGRFVLTHFTHQFGERRFVFVLGIAAIAFQLIAWFVPNVVGDAVAVALIGLFLGPLYPCAQTVFNRLLPANIQVTAIGLISSAGSSGGAVVPFTTGLLAQAEGTFVLHPVCIAFYVLMLGCWVALPRSRKRNE